MNNFTLLKDITDMELMMDAVTTTIYYRFKTVLDENRADLSDDDTSMLLAILTSIERDNNPTLTMELLQTYKNELIKRTECYESGEVE